LILRFLPSSATELTPAKVQEPQNRSPGPGWVGTSQECIKPASHELGSAALLIPIGALFVFSFILTLAALFLLPGLAALLSTLTTLLPSLPALARLAAVLSGLALLTVPLCIVCH
jgi:hypothetical protein